MEKTTGPLGQGFGNAVGLAIAERMLASRFNTEKHRIIDHFTSISIDGKTELTFSDDVPARFQACSWQVLRGNAYDLDGILELVDEAKKTPLNPA